MARTTTYDRVALWEPDPVRVFAPADYDDVTLEHLGDELHDAFDKAMAAFINLMTEIDPHLTIDC